MLSWVREVVEAVENVATSRINVPDRTCHRPVTRTNGYGNVTGKNLRTRPRPAGPRTRDPSRGAIPVSITKRERRGRGERKEGEERGRERGGEREEERVVSAETARYRCVREEEGGEEVETRRTSSCEPVLRVS